MTLLLKVKADSLSDGVAVVPMMKSARLGADDIGATVFIWLGDNDAARGALYTTATLTSFDHIAVPQTRDPEKQKDAYRLALASVDADLISPLSTEDLGPYRHVEGADGMDSLGRIHRDRNDKIVRLTSAEAAVLAERFRH